MSLKSMAVSSLLWKLVERGGASIVQLAVQVVMARLLAPEEFGALAVMLVFVNLGNVFVQSGLNTALIQSPDLEDSDYSTVFWMSSAISAALYIVIYIAAPLLADLYVMPQITWPLRILAILLFLNSYNSVQVAKVTRELEMQKIFIATMLSVALSAGIGVSFAFCGAGIWALVLQQLSYQAVNCTVLSFQVDWKPITVFDSKRARILFSFGWRLLISGLLEQCYQSLSDLIIGKLFTTTQLGFVSQGKKYPQAIGSMIDGAVQPVMLSAVSRVQDEPQSVKRLVRRSLKTSTFAIVPSMVLFACVAPSLIVELLGPQWAGSIHYLQVYCLVYALLPIHTTNLQALNGMGRSDLFLRLELIKKTYGIITLLFCAFVLKSVQALVLSYLVTGVVSTFVNAWPNKRIINYSYWEQICDIAPSILISAAAAGVACGVGALGFAPWMTILCQVMSFALIYLGVAALLRLETFTYLLKLSAELFHLISS